MANSATTRAHWSGRFAFVLAASGSAVGLGNIWKFPYITGVNGGGAFVLVYLLCIAAVGLPVLIAEIYIGKTSQKNAVQAFEATHRQGSPWRLVGWMGVLSAFLILSFYSVVGGWVLDFVTKSLFNHFGGMEADAISKEWGASLGNPMMGVFWHTVFMALTIGIVLGGIKDGIERWSKILMPTLFVLLLILLVRSFALDGFGEAMSFLFYPDFSKLSGEGLLEAIGHSFFTLSLGMGAMITYGSYLGKRENVIGTAITVALLDTIIALVAGSIIFAVCYTHGAEPAAGPGLMFSTLPVLFQKLAGGYIVALFFFVLVAFAALTSAISMLEVVVAYFDEALDWPRTRTTFIMGLVIWFIGIFCALSFNVLGDFKILGLNTFDLFDKLTSQWLLPLGGLFIALFYGWVLGKKAVAGTFANGASAPLVLGLLWSARILAPAAIGLLFAMYIYKEFIAGT